MIVKLSIVNYGSLGRLAASTAGPRAFVFEIGERQVAQYLGTLGSTLSDQAVMPPARFHTFLNPAWRRNSTALALRPPILQWATISRLESSSWTRLGRSPSGMR